MFQQAPSYKKVRKLFPNEHRGGNDICDTAVSIYILFFQVGENGKAHEYRTKENAPYLFSWSILAYLCQAGLYSKFTQNKQGCVNMGNTPSM